MNMQKEFNTVFGSLDTYRRLVENLHAGIYVADAQGRIVYVNHAFVYILGYASKDDLIGHSLADQLYLHPEDRRKFLHDIERVGFVKNYEIDNKRKDGSTVHLSVTSNVIYDEHNAVAGIEGVVYDISDHKKIQSRLSTLEKAVEQTADHVMITDKEGMIQYVNLAFEITTGYTACDVIGQTPRILQSGKQGKGYYQKLWETLLSGETFYGQTVNKKKNGELFVADQTISPVITAGKISHFVSVWKNITEKVRIEESLKTEKKKLEEIIGFDEKICAIRKSERLMDFVVSKAIRILEARKCSIMFVDSERQELYLKAATGFDDHMQERIKIKDSLAAKVIEDGQPVLVKSVSPQHHPVWEEAFRAYSFMIAPIKRDGNIVGVITVADKCNADNAIGSFDATDLKMLCDIAREVAVALENVRFYKQLQFLTVTDPLTNIYNFRHFSSGLDQEIKRLKRIPGDLALMMIDVDDFKSYNDQFGHVAGDVLLKQLVKIIAGNLREMDMLCRYAGDEFAVILPGTQKSGGLILAERIRRSIANGRFKKSMSVSIGLVQYKPSMTRHELTVKADRALYRAKKEGKDKVCLADQ